MPFGGFSPSSEGGSGRPWRTYNAQAERGEAEKKTRAEAEEQLRDDEHSFIAERLDDGYLLVVMGVASIFLGAVATAVQIYCDSYPLGLWTVVGIAVGALMCYLGGKRFSREYYEEARYRWANRKLDELETEALYQGRLLARQSRLERGRR